MLKTHIVDLNMSEIISIWKSKTWPFLQAKARMAKAFFPLLLSLIFVTWTFSGVDKLEKRASLYVIWKDTSVKCAYLAWREKD